MLYNIYYKLNIIFEPLSNKISINYNMVEFFFTNLATRLHGCTVDSYRFKYVLSRCTLGILRQTIVNFNDDSAFSYGQDKDLI